MDEAKRFLRYVTPGLVFLTETLILLWLIEPNVTYTILKDLSKESGVGLAIATLLASGGVGFMFSVVHHHIHWHGRVAKGKSLIKSADPRASSLADLVHSVGTARVAAITAWVFALLILWRTCSIATDVWAILRFIVGNVLAAGFILLYHAGYRRTGQAAQRIAEQVLDDALTQEQKVNGAPIDTYVAL